MAIYSVLEPPARDADATTHAEHFVFVRDGFSVAAFVLGPIWMLWHGMVLALIGYAVVGAAFVFALKAIGASVAAQSLIWPALHLLAGFEAANLRRFALMRRGWQDRGIVAGENYETAERRFFSFWVAHMASSPAPVRPVSPPPDNTSQPPRLRMPLGNDVIGLFPKPGANR
jgi:Protein of unknown function (DUF2628)